MAQQLQASIAQVSVPPAFVPAATYNKEDDRRHSWELFERDNNWHWTSQPTELYSGKTIGWPGYGWVRNFHANDGDFYAEYQPNRGGNNRKYYNLITEKWGDKYLRDQKCPNCGSVYTVIRPGTNHCPTCNNELSYAY